MPPNWSPSLLYVCICIFISIQWSVPYTVNTGFLCISNLRSHIWKRIYINKNISLIPTMFFFPSRSQRKHDLQHRNMGEMCSIRSSYFHTLVSPKQRCRWVLKNEINSTLWQIGDPWRLIVASKSLQTILLMHVYLLGVTQIANPPSQAVCLLHRGIEWISCATIFWLQWAGDGWVTTHDLASIK